MKRIVTLFVVTMVLSFPLAGCDSNRTTGVTDRQKTFEATVLSVNTDSLLVEPAEGTTERNISAQINEVFQFSLIESKQNTLLNRIPMVMIDGKCTMTQAKKAI
ncbi:MAG: hypothetical protein VB018_05000 [Lachnospiraceae bacterium]|nr:hypothetical protein [Lachnospiraceae bacterium]